jgi:O-antigen/teichoic acid export membrane protein
MTGRPLSTRAAYGLGTVSGAMARGLEALCTLAQLWLFTRILPEQEFGRLAFVLAVVQVLSVAGFAGFERLIVFKLSRSDVAPGVLTGGQFAGAALGWAIAVSLVLAAALSLCAAPVAELLGDRNLAGWLRALCWLVPVTAAAETYAGWHLARQRVAEVMLAGRALPAALTTALLVAAWWCGWGATGVVTALVAGRAIVLGGWWLVRPVNPLGFWRHLDRGDARYAVNTAANGLVHKAMRQCDLLMLLPLAGPVLSAQYAVAQRLAWILRGGLELLAPIFTSRAGQLLHGRGTGLLEIEHDVNRAWSTIAALCLALPLMLQGPVFLRAFGGSEEAYPALLILLADQIMFIGLGMSGILLMMAGRSGWSLGSSLAMLGGNVLLNAILVPRLGGTGAALATLISALAAKALSAAMLWRLDRIATVDFNDTCLLANVAGGLLLAAFGLLVPRFLAAVCIAVLVLILLQQVGTIRRALRYQAALLAQRARK